VTPLVANVSLFTKPLYDAVNAGFAAPYAREAASADTVTATGLMARVPLTNVKV